MCVQKIADNYQLNCFIFLLLFRHFGKRFGMNLTVHATSYWVDSGNIEIRNKLGSGVRGSMHLKLNVEYFRRWIITKCLKGLQISTFRFYTFVGSANSRKYDRTKWKLTDVLFQHTLRCRNPRPSRSNRCHRGRPSRDLAGQEVRQRFRNQCASQSGQLWKVNEFRVRKKHWFCVCRFRRQEEANPIQIKFLNAQTFFFAENKEELGRHGRNGRVWAR